MEGNIMSNIRFKKAIPVIVLAVALIGGILAFSFRDRLFGYGLRGNNTGPEITQRNTVDRDNTSGREDMAAPLVNIFRIDNRHYMLMSGYAEEFGLPAQISNEDIGHKITTIKDSPDKSLIDCDVFYYQPAGCEAVVAVKRNDNYELYRFYSFESYINNQDEDAIEYLKLYGINEPEDIAKIQFIIYDEKSRLAGTLNVAGEITNSEEIAKFFEYYSVLKNSSDKYFEKIYGNYAPERSRDVEIDTVNHTEPEKSEPESKDIPVGMPASPVKPSLTPAPATISDMPGSTPATPSQGGTSVAPSRGAAGDALANPVAIRIYNRNGIYFETMYYKNIGFISRYEISDEFASFMKHYTK